MIQDEPRIQNFWDVDNEAAKVIGKMLFPQLKDAVAWDVYLLYAPRIKWEIQGTPPDPVFWMHQLASGSEDLLLDYSRLVEEAKFLLDAEDPDLEDRGITEVLQTKKKEARK